MENKSFYRLSVTHSIVPSQSNPKEPVDDFMIQLAVLIFMEIVKQHFDTYDWSFTAGHE